MMRPGKERAAVRARMMPYLPAPLDHVDELAVAIERPRGRVRPVASGVDDPCPPGGGPTAGRASAVRPRDTATGPVSP
jgi:hypothetical protein